MGISIHVARLVSHIARLKVGIHLTQAEQGDNGTLNSPRLLCVVNVLDDPDSHIAFC
jgi:hypothetical protein